MNKAKLIIALIGLGILVWFIILEKYPPTDKASISSVPDSLQVVVKKRYDEFNKLKADVEMVNGVKHGVAHNYYDNGSIHTIIHYKNGIKHGPSLWLYEDGKTYRETPFVKGKKHGMVKKYYQNGRLMAEIPYENNTLIPGTKEYTELGKPIHSYPAFSYNVVDKTIPQKARYLEVKGKNLSMVSAYSAHYLQNGNKIALYGEREPNLFRFLIPPAIYDNNIKEVYVWLTLKTKMKNNKIIEKKVTLSK